MPTRGTRPGSSRLTCRSCGETWAPASGADCPACLARGRGRDADGKLKPDTRWYDANARSSGIQASTEALKRSRTCDPKPEKHKFCRRCAAALTVGDHKIFCGPCRVEQKRDTSLARYYRLKAESRCPHCKAPVVSSVLCESCKARMLAKPTTDRELRMMKRSRRTLHAGRQARGVCIYCEAPNTTQVPRVSRLSALPVKRATQISQPRQLTLHHVVRNHYM